MDAKEPEDLELEESKEPKIDEDLEALLGEMKDPLPAELPAAKSVIEPVPMVAVDEIQEPKEPEDVKIVLGKFHNVTDQIIHNWKCDRDEVGDTIERLKDMMMASPKPPGYVIESLVSALRTKSDNNSNIIKLLDAFAKIISSTKNTSIISQSTSIDLSSLLGDDD